MQRAFNRHGLTNFQFVIYEYFVADNTSINNNALIALETNYISKFEPKALYNFKLIANSMLGYKHTEIAKAKMIARFANKNNHPMFGKKHNKNVLSLISKPGILNPMFGKKHNSITKNLISDKMSKYILGVGIYDLNNNLLKQFKNNVELAKYLNISKVTVGKYLNNKLVYKEKFIFKPIDK